MDDKRNQPQDADAEIGRMTVKKKPRKKTKERPSLYISVWTFMEMFFFWQKKKNSGKK